MKVLAHLDDVGSSHGSVVAWQALRTAGVVRSASVMVPCPWHPLARDDWQDDPDQDMGVHITLTSEWSAYRWRPLTGWLERLGPWVMILAGLYVLADTGTDIL